MPDIERVRRVKEKHQDRLLRVEGVVGVGVGKCKRGFCVRVYVRRGVNLDRGQIPERLDGVDLEVREVGEIVAY